MNKKIQILDCTLRDGGFSLEDAEKNGIPHKDFNEKLVNKIANSLSKSKVDIVELGAIEETECDMRRFSIYPTIEAISQIIPQDSSGQLHAMLFRGPDIMLQNLPDFSEGLCEIARVCLRYSELKSSLDYCRGLRAKGYKVALQPVLTMRYKKEDLDLIIKTSNEIDAYTLYFVDSYGYMGYGDVKYLLEYYNSRLNPNIRIGFHAHNNMNLAFANVISFLESDIERELVVDSCCMGMGQGAGNLQTELIVPYLNEVYKSNYNFNAVLEVCEELEEYRGNILWGYSPLTLIPAVRKTAYKYAIALKKHYNFTLTQINDFLMFVEDGVKQHRYTNEHHRYTKETLKALLKDYWEAKK